MRSLPITNKLSDAAYIRLSTDRRARRMDLECVNQHLNGADADRSPCVVITPHLFFFA